MARALPLDAFTVGGREADWLDTRGAWTRVREYGPSGAILVRPDRFIAWRAKAGSPRPDADLHAVFDAVLGIAA